MNADTFQRITTRNDIARDIIAGFAAVTPTLAGVFRLVDSALADVPAVLADLGRVRAELEAVRLDRANLLAAIRACLAADADGEDDPLGYLRDELDATGTPATAPGGGHDQLPADAPERTPRPPRRAAAHHGHQHRRPVSHPGGRDPRPRRVAVPFRDRARLHGVRDARGGLVGASRAPELVAVPARRLRPIRGGARAVRRAARLAPARRAGLCGHGGVRGGRLAGGRRPARPAHPAAPAGPGRRRGRARGSVVGAPAPPREGARAADARGVAGHLHARSACQGRRSCRRTWTCGDGGHGSAWPAGRPSPT